MVIGPVKAVVVAMGINIGGNRDLEYHRNSKNDKSCHRHGIMTSAGNGNGNPLRIFLQANVVCIHIPKDLIDGVVIMSK